MDFRNLEGVLVLKNIVSDTNSEKDFDVSEGDYTTHFRMLDTRLARWKSVDPKARLMPWQSPYNSMDENPVFNTDKDGDCPTCPAGAVGFVLGGFFGELSK